MKVTAELLIALVSLVGAIVLFILDKTEPAMLLLGTGGYGAVRGAATRKPKTED